MRSKRRTNNPLVVGLVQGLVNRGPVQPSVNKVNSAIGEKDESGNGKPKEFPASSGVVDGVVQLGETLQLKHKERVGQEHHDWDRSSGLDDFQPHLVLQVSGMVEDLSVKHIHVGQASSQKVQQPPKDGGYDKDGQGFSQHVGSGEKRLVSPYGGCHQLGRHFTVDLVLALQFSNETCCKLHREWEGPSGARGGEAGVAGSGSSSFQACDGVVMGKY